MSSKPAVTPSSAYADDIRICVRSRRAGKRVLESVTRFLGDRNAAQNAGDRPPDTNPPLVSWIKPADGETMSGYFEASWGYDHGE